MILAVKNNTASAIPGLGLLANEIKTVWMNKTWFTDQTLIREKLRDGSIEFYDENSAKIIYWNGTEIVGDDDILAPMIHLLFRVLPTDEAITRAEREACMDIFQIIAVMFRKAKKNNGLPGYTDDNMIDALQTKNVFELLLLGRNKGAGNGINAIATDAFFTVDRKTLLKSICDSINL